ncbi:hypothetical protein ACLKA6_004596, partial [Drosophila palustris]
QDAGTVNRQITSSAAAWLRSARYFVIAAGGPILFVLSALIVRETGRGARRERENRARE